MKRDITGALVEEHRLILRMINLLERNALATAEGGYANWRFYLDGVDFIRSYADRFHHAKEEDILFKALIENGMPAANSPVAAMLMEHQQGRDFVARMERGASDAMAGIPDQEQDIAENALAYAALLRDHISKEDGILYPLAERVLPDAVRPEIVKRYRESEGKTPQEFTDHYRSIVERYERE